MTKTTISNLFFLISYPALGIVIGWVFLFFGVKVRAETLIAITTGGIVSFSLTASVLLLTMPRSNNQYLEQLDKDKRIFGYVLCIATPGCFSLLSSTLSSLTLGNELPLADFGQALFWVSLITTFRAVFVLKKIIENASTRGKIFHNKIT